MLYNRKTKLKMQMAILYAFANLTLIGREILFLDVFLSGNGFTNSEYLFFSSFSTYTFLMTALAYQLFILDLTYVTRQARFIEDSTEAAKLRKHDQCWKYAVGVLIVMCIITFITDFCIEQNESTTNQLDRGVIIISYIIVGLVFFVFSYRLLTEIKRNLHGPVAIRNARKVRIVLFVFLFAIIYRIVFNVAYITSGSKMCDFNNRHP